MTLRTWISSLAFLLAATLAAQPSNDDPCNAIELNIGTSCSSVAYTNALATASGGVSTPSCGNYAGGDVWYQLTMPNNGYHVTLELTAGGAFDGGISVYSGSCAALSEQFCDDNSGLGNNPSLTLDDGCNFSNINQTYWVRVWENGNDANGTFNLCAYAHPPAVPADVTGCGSFPVAGNSCCDAILLSDLFDGYCGNTGGYTANNTGMSAFCANIENNSWLAFTASAPTAIFDIAASACQSGDGIQVAVFETADCSNFNLVSNCWNPNTETSGTITATGLTPGQVYYVMVDGFLEDTCDYTINVTTGIDQTNATVDDEVICLGNSTTLRTNVVGVGPFTYNWMPAASLDDPSAASPVATPTTSTNYSVTITGPSGSSVHTVAVTVYNGAPGNLAISGANNLCEGATNELFSAAADNASSYNWTVTGGTIVGPNNAASVSVDWGNGNGSICVTATNQCGTSSPVCQNITVIPRPNISAQDPPVTCAPNTVNLSSIIINNTGGGGGFVTYHADSMDAVVGTPFLPSTIVSLSGTYWIRMASGANCYDVTSIDVTIEDPQVTVVHPQPTCSPNTIDLASVAVSGTGGYPNSSTLFFADSLDATIRANAMSNTVVSSGGTYWLRFETENGCFDVEAINVDIDVTPDLPDVIQLPNICPGERVDLDTVSLPDANNASLTFAYYYSSIFVAQLGLPGLAIPNTTVGAGSYWVWTGTAGGCSDIAEVRVVESTPPTASISGGGAVCPGDSVDVSFQLTGTPPFAVVLSEGANTYNLSDLSNGDVIRFAVTGNMSFDITSVTDATTCPGTFSGGPVTASLLTAPTAVMSGGGRICQGDDAILSFTLTGSGPFDLEYQDDMGNRFPLTNVPNGHTVTHMPTTNTTYTLLSVTDNTTCSGSASGTAVFEVSPPLQVINLSEDCNVAKTSYTVRFEITGGNPAAYVVNGLMGTLTGNVFVSDPMPSNTAYSYTVSDDSGCPSVTGNGQRECDCQTSAGSMDPTPLQACSNAAVTATHNADQSLESGDVMQFILHDNAGTSIGTIFAIGATPTFSLVGGMTTGTTYYISAIAGPNNGSGTVDQSHKCLSVAPGTPVVFIDLPQAEISGDASICAGETSQLTLNFTAGTAPFDVIISDGAGGMINLDNIVDGHQLDVTPSATTVYTIMSVIDNTSALCDGVGQGSASVTVQDAIQLTSLQELCSVDKTTYTVSFSISGGASGPYVVNGGTGTLTGNQFTSDPIPANTAYNFSISDGGACPAVDISGIFDCQCTTDPGSMQSDTLHLCAGIDVVAIHNADEVLDASSGDLLQFVLHDGTAAGIGTVMAVSNNPQFPYNNSFSSEVVYHVTAIAGPDDGFGQVDVLHKCYRISNGTPVRYYDLPELSMSGNATICPGDSADLIFAVQGGQAPFTVTVDDGQGTITITDVVDGHRFRVAPSSSTTYNLVSVTDQTVAACTGTASGSANIQIIDLPVVNNFQIVCNSTNTAYQVQFEISGGNPAQYVVNGGSGTLDGPTRIFTSDPINSGDAYNFSVSDGNPCGPIELIGDHVCECSSQVGSMGTNRVEVCDDQLANVDYDAAAEVRDGNDVLGFVLHDLPGTTLGTVFQRSPSPAFAYDAALIHGTTYYVSAIIGNDDGSGAPVLDQNADLCLSISLGQPIVFYPVPTAGISGSTTICEGETASLTFALEGWPNFDVRYTDGTDTFALLNINDAHTVDVRPLTTTTYRAIYVRGGSDASCVGTVDPAMETVTIDVIDVPEVTNLSIACNDAGLAYSVSFEIEGGNVANYQISGDTVAQLAGNEFTSSFYLGGETYYFEITDGSGCPPIVLTSTEYCNCTPDILPQIEEVRSIRCAGEANGSLRVESLGGEAPFRFQWSNGEEGEFIDSLAQGWYWVTMTDANDCESVDSFFLASPEPIVASLTSTSPRCFGESNGEVFFTNVGGGTEPLRMTLNGQESVGDSLFFALPAGQYVGQISDVNGCFWEDSIIVSDPEQLIVELGDNEEIILGDSVLIRAEPNLPIDTFVWTSNVNMPCDDCLETFVKPDFTTIYSIEVRDEDGCVATDNVTVIVSSDIPVYAPTIFSPNGDGVNETFVLYGGQGVVMIESLRLFDRWGEVLFEGLDIQPGDEARGWDGRFRQKRMSTGVYVYQARIRFIDGSVRVFNGDVTLMR